jgi:hypothetical protein
MVALVMIALVAGLLLLTCSPDPCLFVDSDQPDAGDGMAAGLEPGRPVGQTFVARHAGLTGIEFFLLPETNASLTLTLHLRDDPRAATDLVAVSTRLPQGAMPGFLRFSFPPLAASHGRYLYAYLESDAPGAAVALNGGPVYRDGAAYRAHDPLDAQTGFRLIYAPGHVLLDLLRAALGWLGLLGVAGLLYVVPGWALLAWLLPGGRLTWAEMMGLAAGLSLALYPLLLLWTDLVGLHLGPLYAWLPVAVGLAALAWRYRVWRPRQRWRKVQQWARSLRSEALWPDLLLLIALGLVFGVRLLVVRTLAAPMWGDSYHHTLIAQLLVDHGGLFDSWEPYAPLQSFTYHFGFHTAVGLHTWVMGTEPVDSILTVGQIVNGLAVLSLYPLATKVSRNRWAGMLAVLVAGLLSPMPMGYLNWGRYVQLTGQVVLPVAVWLAWKAVESSSLRPGLALLTGLALAGLFLAHYRVTIFFIPFLFLLWAASALRAREAKRKLYIATQRILLVSLAALLLVLPWIWHLGAGHLPEILGQFARSPASAEFVSMQASLLRGATVYLPGPLLIAALLGIVTGLVQRRGWALFLVLWILLVVLIANPNWLGLPGAATRSNFAGVLNNFAVLISLYMPVSILCGYLGGIAVDRLPRRWPVLRRVVVAAIFLALSLVGVRNALHTVQASNILVTVPDLQAMRWIEGQTAQTARFLTNSFFAYDDNVIVGSDGGWWIPLLAGRANTVPPITYGHEAAQDPDYLDRVNSLAKSLETGNAADAEFIQVLRDNHVTHVYIGQTGGYLVPEAFQRSDAYNLVYHRDRVWVFELQ